MNIIVNITAHFPGRKIKKEGGIMLELSTHEVTCPVCKREFYPETSVKREVLCGEELYPYNKAVAKVLDCRIHYFCSEKCFKQFHKEERKGQNISRWKLLLERISKKNSEHSSGEILRHNFYRAKKSS
jgi:ribosomal protein L24E